MIVLTHPVQTAHCVETTEGYQHQERADGLFLMALWNDGGL